MTGLRPTFRFEHESLAQVAWRWVLAGLCVLAFHGGMAYAVLNWPREASVAAPLPAAVMIELAPLAMAPDVPPQDVALAPQMQMSQAATPSEPDDDPVEPQKPEPDIRQPVETEIEVPLLPEQPKADAVLIPTRPPPSKPQDKPKKEARKPDRQKNARKKSQQNSAPNAPATAAPEPAPVPLAATNAAPMAGTSSSTSPANWRSAVMALLNRHKRFPAGGGPGTVGVTFVIDRSGRVLSARLAASSGNVVLDQEAVALAHRVSPLPPPPDNIGGGSIVLAVPIRFGE